MKKGPVRHIIFTEAKVQIEWFLMIGKSPAREYFNDLPYERRESAYNLFCFLANIGKIYNIKNFDTKVIRLHLNQSRQVFMFFLCRRKSNRHKCI